MSLRASKRDLKPIFVTVDPVCMYFSLRSWMYVQCTLAAERQRRYLAGVRLWESLRAEIFDFGVSMFVKTTDCVSYNLSNFTGITC